MFGRLCHLFVHALSSLQVANAQCMTLRSLAPCLRAVREKYRFAAGKKHRNGKNAFGSRKKRLAAGKSCFRSGKKRQQKMPLRSAKNSKQQKKHLAAAQKHLCNRKNAFWRQREKTVRGGKNPSEARKTGRGRKKTSSRESPALQPKKLPQRKNTFPQREKAAALDLGWSLRGKTSSLMIGSEFPQKQTLLAGQSSICRQFWISISLIFLSKHRGLSSWCLAGWVSCFLSQS